MPRKPDILKNHAEHVRLGKELKEVERQARKFAEQVIAFETAGKPARAARARAQALQWLIVEKGIKEQLAQLEPIVSANRRPANGRQGRADGRSR